MTIEEEMSKWRPEKTCRQQIIHKLHVEPGWRREE